MPRALLPRALFVTDPGRVADPVAVAARLPRGTGVVFRAFGAQDAVQVGRALSRVCRERGLVLLAGADEALAEAIAADGIHLPERLATRARALRARHPQWLITAAAHGLTAARRARALGVDAVLASPVFESRSSSAGRPLGLMRFAAIARHAGLPVYALGGADMKKAPRLLSAGALGIAAVDGFRT